MIWYRKLVLYSRIPILNGNIIKHTLRTSMNEQAHFFIKICISHTLFSKMLMFLWCVRDGWRDIYSERGLLLPWAKGCQRLHPLARSSETPLIGCVFLARLRFSALCLNLTVWFSTLDLLPVTHLSGLSALIVLSCLLIKMWQLAKHTRSLGTNRKSMAYVI